jgi:hypothetical protein
MQRSRVGVSSIFTVILYISSDYVAPIRGNLLLNELYDESGCGWEKDEQKLRVFETDPKL